MDTLVPRPLTYLCLHSYLILSDHPGDGYQNWMNVSHQGWVRGWLLYWIEEFLEQVLMYLETKCIPWVTGERSTKIETVPGKCSPPCLALAQGLISSMLLLVHTMERNLTLLPPSVLCLLCPWIISFISFKKKIVIPTYRDTGSSWSSAPYTSIQQIRAGSPCRVSYTVHWLDDTVPVPNIGVSSQVSHSLILYIVTNSDVFIRVL